MDVSLYRFATLKDGLERVKQQAYELERRRHSDGTLSEEELDWLDWANSVTSTANSQPVVA